MDRLLKADMDTLKPEAVDETGGVIGLNREMGEDAWPQEQP